MDMKAETYTIMVCLKEYRLILKTRGDSVEEVSFFFDTCHSNS